MIRVKPKTQHRIRLAPRRVRHMIHTKSCHLHYKQKESRPFWREWDHFTWLLHHLWPNMGMRGCQVSFYDLVLSELKLFYTPHWFPCDCEAPACWRSNFVETPQMRMKQKWSSRFDHRCKDRRESIPFVRNPVLFFNTGGWCNNETSCINSKRPKNILHNVTFWL